jgi:hypothetical protein
LPHGRVRTIVKPAPIAAFVTESMSSLPYSSKPRTNAAMLMSPGSECVRYELFESILDTSRRIFRTRASVSISAVMTFVIKGTANQ